MIHDAILTQEMYVRDLQRSKAGGLSPRSMRLSHVLPKPKGAFGTTLAHLTYTRGQLADMHEYTRKVQATVGSFLKRHFETIPQNQVDIKMMFL